MPKPRYKTTNWKQYNKALINRGSLTFTQVGETYAMIKALNKLTGLGMPETQYIV
ncbi:hypothetical protein [Vibrio diazotrophicus]|uniref:IS5/IS1182 family transposase n=1 Tax=Vibrio diazotrophicus TaxID=685 RepID=A0A329EBY6_VIBDI|nr:hypothetical protein [Vibrio diazotrophicus]RAS65293.1 hypothetical protein DET48_1075 [Vibrio diazotrophicus]